jgi:hypothetical protein
VNNKMIVNKWKTKEIVFSCPNPRLNMDVLPVWGVDQVDEVEHNSWCYVFS